MGDCKTWGSSVFYMDVLKVQLATSEAGIFFPNDKPAVNSIINYEKIYIHLSFNADTINVRISHIKTSYHDVIECEKEIPVCTDY